MVPWNERWGVLGRLRRSFGQNMECFGVHNWGLGWVWVGDGKKNINKNMLTEIEIRGKVNDR